MKPTMKVQGFRELERALAEDLPKATARNVLRRAAMTAMRPMEIQARARAPRETGDLAGSITTQLVKTKRVSRTSYARSGGVEVATGPAPIGLLDRSNAGWQEFGTVQMPANPYMRPAIDAAAETVIEIVRDELATEIAKATKRIAKKAAKKR